MSQEVTEEQQPSSRKSSIESESDIKPSSRKSSTEQDEVQERGVVLDLLKDPQVQELAVGCCVHFLQSSCCGQQKKEEAVVLEKGVLRVSRSSTD
jgi:hypothetical protein